MRLYVIKFVFLLILLQLQLFQTVNAGKPNEENKEIPKRYALGLSYAQNYTPNTNLNFVQFWGSVEWDYDAIWPHEAPKGLRFKLEGSAGITSRPFNQALLSTGIMAKYYVPKWATKNLKPYIQGGVHAIYTDFKFEDQGSTFNFNPMLGAGFDFGKNQNYFSEFRLHHISNGDLNKDNTGINSVLLMTGIYF